MTPEQNLRQAIIDSTPRDRMIEIIARHIWNVESVKRGKNANRGMAPVEWYRSSFTKRR